MELKGEYNPEILEDPDEIAALIEKIRRAKGVCQPRENRMRGRNRVEQAAGDSPG